MGVPLPWRVRMPSYPCPFCGVIASVEAGCPGCGRPGDPAAAEVVRLDAELPVLTGEVERARAGLADARQRVAMAQHEVVASERRLGEAQQRHSTLVLAVRTRMAAAPAPATPGVTGPGSTAPGSTAPGSTAPGSTAPGSTAPGSAAPGATTSVPIGSGPAAGMAAGRMSDPTGAAWRPGPAPETSTRTVQNLLFVLGGLLLGIGAIVFTVVAWADLGTGARAAILGGFTLLTLSVPLLATRRG